MSSRNEPQRIKLGLPAKIWLPAKQGSEIIMGNHHYIPRLNENCKNLEMLLDKSHRAILK